MNSICIFCQRDHTDTTIEHIIPRSLGNIHYILPKGKVCNKCNHRFSKYENQVLSSPAFMEERRRLKILHASNQQIGPPMKLASKNNFLLKMAYEAIYKSRPKLLDQYDLEPVREHLVSGKVLSFLDNQKLGPIQTQKSIPKWLQAFRLKNGKMKLEYLETVDQRLFVQFQLGRLIMRTRLA